MTLRFCGHVWTMSGNPSRLLSSTALLATYLRPSLPTPETPATADLTKLPEVTNSAGWYSNVVAWQLWTCAVLGNAPVHLRQAASSLASICRRYDRFQTGDCVAEPGTVRSTK